jgi:hypothetical protein
VADIERKFQVSKALDVEKVFRGFKNVVKGAGRVIAVEG